MKRFSFLATLVALFLVSCVKENAIETGEQNGYLRYFAPQLPAAYTTEAVKSSVSMPEGTVSFVDGDQVLVSNGSTAVKFRYSAAKNLFYSDGDLPLTGSISAFYPAEYCSSLTSEGKFNVSMPAQQVYLTGEVVKAPMGGSYQAGTMRFNNLCAILSIPLIGEEIFNSISFSTPQAPVSGEGVADANSLVLNESSAKTVSVDLSVSSFVSGQSAYILLPSQNYPGGFTLQGTTASGLGFSYKRETDVYLSPSCISVNEAVECTEFSGGHGTAESPYRISRPEDLMRLRDLIDSEEYEKFCDKHYIQTCDISYANYNNGVIRVIGTENGQEFKGVYDGQGYKISDGKIVRSYDRVALFGGAIGATIKNLTFENCNIPSGNRSIGYVVGLATEGTTVDNCHVYGGTATSNWTGIGSIVGELKGSTVKNCTSSATIQGSNGTTYSGAGGIVGYIDKGVSTISNCTFTGKVEALYNEKYPTFRANNSGGIVGYICNSPSVVKDCKFSGSISGRAGYMGGIVGRCSSAATVDNCQVEAKASIAGSTEVADTAMAIGGVIGGYENNNVYGEIRKCTFAGTVSGSFSGVGGIIGEVNGPAKVMDCAVLSGAKISGTAFAVGGIVGNSLLYGSLGMIRNCTVTGATISATQWGVGGISARNYGLNVSACQVKNTTITATDNNAGGISGVTYGNVSYTDCTVENCTITSSSTLAAGVVAEINSYSNTRNNIRNCYVKGSKIQSKYYTGGIAGNVKNPTLVDQCYVSGTSVTSTNGGEAGGILGKTSTSGILVANCMFWDGDISGSTQTSGIGGIVGSFYSEHGLTAGKSLSTTTIVNCVANPKSLKNTNSTSNSAMLGGVAGHMAYTRMINSYSPTPSASIVFSGNGGSEDKRGSLYGYLIYGGEVVNCYWLQNFTEGLANSTYTYTSKTQKATDEQMRQVAANNTFFVPSEYPDGDYRKSNMTEALNKGVSLYNATSVLYGVQAINWVKTSSYAYPVLAGSPLDGGSSTTPAKKRVAILGDSISTFQDWSNNVSNYQYPKSGYETFTVQDTYWYQLIYNKMSNAVLDVNSSYCGSTVQNNASKGKPSFISRYSDLRNPDIIFINGGTNDSWSYKLPLGTLDFSLSLDQLDTYQFAQAYDKLIRLLKRDYPQAKIFLIIGDCLRDYPTYTKVITDLADHYDLKYAQITFADRTTMTYQRTGTSDINVHPNIAGMKEMSNQIWNQLKSYL